MTHRKLTLVAAGLVAAAAMATTAAAHDGGSASSHDTPEALTALELRWQAMAESYRQPITNGTAPSYRRSALDAHDRGSVTPVRVDTVEPGPSAEFDWIDAGVGAGAMFALAALVAGGLAIRSRRSIKLAVR